MRLPNQFWEITERLMDVVWNGTGFPVVVYDHEGTIVRATDKSRIGDLHAGAQKIMLGLVDEYAVTPEEAAGNPLFREGYNCAIVKRWNSVNRIDFCHIGLRTYSIRILPELLLQPSIRKEETPCLPTITIAKNVKSPSLLS
jgi:hypothetical protein